MEKLNRSKVPLTVSVPHDEFIAASEKAFDCAFDGTSKFYPWLKPDLPKDYNIGVIVGSSGSGKSTLLKKFGIERIPKWSKKSIVSNFRTPDDAINALSAVGLNTVPSWYKPYHVLSNGEKFRANLAYKLDCARDDGYLIVDEFTSVVDRNVAKAASVSISKYIKKYNIKNVVLSTCHRDILDWLEPDWLIDTDLGEYTEGFFLLDQKSKLTFIEQIRTSGQCLKTITI
jgi:hypothetical protein